MRTVAKEQNFANHARFVPGYHYVTALLAIVLLLWALYRLIALRTADALFGALIAVVLTGTALYARSFALAVQDRLICLEEKLRYAALVPAEGASLHDRLTPDQIIALRFASDAELPALARRVLDENITQRKAIKSLIVNWRPDHMRA